MDAGSAGPPSALAPGLASDGGLRPARPTLKKGGAVGFNAAPRIGDDAQARVDDFDEPLARGKPKGKKPTAAGDSADAALVWRAEGWRTKDKPHCELVVACRALEQSGADRAWLCKDGQPVPLESDEAVLHHARRSGSAARSRFVAVCVAGAATEAAAHRRHALQRAQMLKACASGSQGAAPGPLGAALFDAARLRTRETRLYAPTPGCMGGAAHAQKARSERQALYAIPSVNGNASVLCRPSDGDGAAPVADDAPRDEPVADDDADDAVSRRLKRPGRGVGRADVKARWRDVEQSAADLLSNCARADEGKRKDSAPTLAQVLDVFRQADELAAPTELYSGCDEHIRALQATLKELQAYVSDVRLLACRARDAVARAVRPEFRLAADDATGYGNYFYASKHAAASAAAADKPEAKEAVKTDSKKPESGKKPNGQKPNGRPRSSSDLRASNKAKPKPKKEVVEEEAEEEEEEDWPTAPKAPMKPPLDDAELVLKSLRAAAVFDEYTHASLSDAVRAARAWGKRADDALDRHATARELRGLADAAEATPFADEAKRLALDQRASEAHAFDCRVREALRRPATIPALVGLREAADGLVCFLETRETVNRLSDVGAAWQADADRVLRGSVPPARSTTLKLIAVADADFQVAGRHFAPLDFGQDVHFLKRKAREAEAWISRAAGCVASFEDCSDDCDEEALASLVGQAKTLPVPAVVRDALARKLDVRRWRREARAAVQSTAAAADGSVSAKPSLASVRSHLAEIDQLRAAARKALALPKAAAVKTEDDESAALADAAAAPTAPAAPTGTADKAVDEAIKKEDVSGDAAVEDDDCGSEEASHALIGALAAAAVASCRAECAQTTDDERELARILQLAEDWALVAKAAKPVAVDDARRLAPTLSTIDDVVRAGEALPLDVSQQLRPLRAAKRLAVAWLESSKRVRHKCGIEDTTEDQGPSEPPPSPASKKANGGASAKKTPGKTSPRGANAGSSRKRKASPPPAAPAPGGRAMTRGAAKRQATPDDAADDATADGDGDAAAPVASSPMVVVVRVKPRDDASTESGTPAQTPAQTPRDSAPPSVAGDASVADDDDDDDDDDENEEDALVTLPELAATLASAKRLSARVDELAQLRMFASRVDAWCHRHREVCPPRRNEPERRSAPKAKADAANSSAPKALADKAAARGEAREAREAQEAVDDAAHKPTPDDLTNLNSAFSAVETQLDVATERAALATRLSDATAARDAVNALVRRVVADAVKALPEHEIRLKALESTARTAEAAETAFTEEAGEGDAGDGAVDSNPGDAKAADAKADPKADPKAVADPKAGADKLAAEKKALKAAAAGDDSDWDSDVDAELEEGDFADARKLLAAELGRFGELSAALRATPRVATRDDARAHDALALQAWCHKARRACSAAAALRGSDSLAERGVDADDVAFLAKQGTDLLMMGMPPMVVPPPPPPGQGRGGYYQQHHQYQVQQQQQYAVQQQALLGHAAGPAASPPPADGEDRLADDLAASRALVSFWRDRLATLQRRFSGVHAWRRAAKAAADRRVVSHRELNELIAAAMDLQRDATLRGSVHEFKHKLDDRLTWLRNVDAALRGPNKRALKDVDALSRDAQKLWLQDSDDARALKMYAKQARAWLARVKKTGIERGEASIAELRALMPEADAIRVDLSADVEVLRQASYATCLCAQPAEGDMLKCISCCELFHRSCVLPRLAEAAVAVAKKKPKRSSSQPAKGNGNNAAAAQKRKRGEANEPSKDTAATDAAAADAASRPGSPDSVAPAVAAVGALALPAVPALPPFFQCPRCILRQLAAADAAAAETLARVAAHTPFCAAAAAALAAPTEADFAARVAGVAAAAANDDERDVSLALRRVAWAYDGLRALERPLQRAAVGVLALRASQLGAPEAASAHFAACCKQADALAARLAAAVAAAPPPPPPAAIDAAALQRTNSASKRGTTARAAAVAAAKPKDAEKKAPSERPIDLAHVRAVAVAARRVPVHLTRLRRRCAAIADDGGARYCACRGPSDGTFMVSCEKCEEWFHGRCVRLTESAADVEFVCYKCGGAATPPNGEADDPLADDADDPPPKNIGEIPWPPSKLLDCMAAHLDATGAAKRAHERAFLDAKKAAADAMQLEDGGAAAAAAVEGLDGTAPAPAAFDAPVPPREEPVVMEVQAPILGVPMDSTEATIVQTLMDIGAPMDIAAPMVTPAATPAAPEPAPPVADAQ